MAEESKFSPKVDKLVADLNSEFKEKIEKYPGNILNNRKLYNLSIMMNFYSEKICQKVIDSVKFYKNSANQQFLNTSLKLLETCVEPFNNSIKE